MRHLILLFSFFAISASAQVERLEKLLSAIPDLTYKKIDTPPGYESAYVLKIKQPLDHNDPSKGSFYQKVYLSHKGFDKHMVMDTRGYMAKNNAIFELTGFLGANQLEIEHRFYGESVPDSLDYRYLSMKQVCADLHHVNEIFKKIYTGKWISTGRSKGGMTTTYYRYFYPKDVDAGVAYVAPISQGLPDKRIFRFFDTVGTADCRAKIRDFQVRMLKERDKTIPMLKAYAEKKNLKFTTLTLDQVWEYSLMEFEFSFWQHSCKCEEIPGNDVPLEKAAAYIIEGSYPEFYADDALASSLVTHYLHVTELGYYGFETSKFKGLIKALPADSFPLATFIPKGMKTVYDPTLSRKVAEWVDKEARNHIFIYGMLDPWTAAGAPPSKKTNSVWILMKDKHHKNALIANMTAEEKKRFSDALEGWLK